MRLQSPVRPVRHAVKLVDVERCASVARQQAGAVKVCQQRLGFWQLAQLLQPHGIEALKDVAAFALTRGVAMRFVKPRIPPSASGGGALIVGKYPCEEEKPGQRCSAASLTECSLN